MMGSMCSQSHEEGFKITLKGALNTWNHMMGSMCSQTHEEGFKIMPKGALYLHKDF